MDIDFAQFGEVEEDNQAITVTKNGHRVVISKVTGLVMWNNEIVTLKDDFHKEQIVLFILRNMV